MVKGKRSPRVGPKAPVSVSGGSPSNPDRRRLRRGQPVGETAGPSEVLPDGEILVCVALYDRGLVGRFVASGNSLDDAM